MRIQLQQTEDPTQLRQRSRQQRDAKQRALYRAILLALEGHDAPAIAETLSCSRAFVQRWVYVYRDHGLDAVTPKRRTGRPPNLAATQEGAFKAFPGRADRGRWGVHPAGQRRPADSPRGIRGRVYAARRVRSPSPLGAFLPDAASTTSKERSQADAAMDRERPLFSSMSPKRPRGRRSRSGSKTKRGSVSKEP